MGRSEKPLDPTAGPVQRFAHDLRALRRAAKSPTYRDMARRTGYSAPTLSSAAAGERPPSLPVTLAYVAACGGHPDEWERRWRELTERLPSGPTPSPDDPAPYRGLARFETTDDGLFFGREHLVGDLLEMTRKHPFVALVGPSGSGKSSLLRAGLVPALRRLPENGGRPSTIRICTPGETPLTTHGGLLSPVEGAAPTVLLVDQFEELFTLCRDPSERSGFLQGLLHSRPILGEGGLRVVVTVRADFYGHCADHPELVEALNTATQLVGSMSPEQVRDAIVKPATASRLVVERALTSQIIADMAQEPGALPLMSHTLLELWHRRRARTLTLQAYRAIGGIQGAVAHTAEELFRDMSEAQAGLARMMLLRLIAPGDGAPDTRRPVDRDELARSPEAEAVLERLVRARLVTADDATMNLSHEALITAWPRLHTWVEADRERLRLQRRLTEAAREWAQLDRDSDALYRGTRLVAARDAFIKTDGSADDLTPLEREFLMESLRRGRYTRPFVAVSRRFVRSRWWLVFRLATACSMVLWTVWFLNRDHP
ncbi:helix-turn-helix domain-containing protein [Streptomyces sp. WG5]|uniref:nSTAND1 domain-containing NTPase n=1 Tax=Streptomyces sp. WG5 TaxID=3417648 RepID=UPI003CF908AC